MKICAFKIQLDTAEGQFGFETTFSEKLNIIRGNNSSGKSTIYNSLIYCLGMEEIIGAKGPKVLPYAVREYFTYENRRINITSSKVMLEIKNHEGRVITISRAISDANKSNKLIEVLIGPVLTQKIVPTQIISTYIHDGGGASKAEGFHNFLEKFINLTLPSVPLSNNSSHTKLYLQTIFAALIVEQKRGWSDYIANIPYYGIRDAKTHVVEYLLNLKVFDNNALLDNLNRESLKLHQDWELNFREVQKISNDLGISVSNVSNKLTSEFNLENLSLNKITFDGEFDLDLYIKDLQVQAQNLDISKPVNNSSDTQEQLSKIDSLMKDIQKLSESYESLISRENLSKASIVEYESFLVETREDLERNKAVFKLKSLGAELNIKTASGYCPTCNSSISDSLSHQLAEVNEMSLEENINYLARQAEMMRRQIDGIRAEIVDMEVIKSDITKRINERRALLATLRKAVFTGESNLKATYMRQVQIEDELKKLEAGSVALEVNFETMKTLSSEFRANQEKRKALPRNLLSDEDINTINIFQSFFRSNASAFGYSSADVLDIEINIDSLTPYLSSIELKEIADVKSDSSASDFVRLIWSYLIGLYQTSSFNNQNGNHPGFILFDEPGQHSMGEPSQRALFNLLASHNGLQSIVAASFDESDTVFKEVTNGISFNLISLDMKCIEPLKI